jgi:hypothetical protein
VRDSLSAAEEEERKMYFAVADGSRNGGIEDRIGLDWMGSVDGRHWSLKAARQKFSLV